MEHLPQTTEIAFRRNTQIIEKHSAVANKIQASFLKEFAGLSDREQKKITASAVREAERRAATEEKAGRRALNDIRKNLNAITRETKNWSDKQKSVFSGVFSGSFFGNILGHLTSKLTGVLSRAGGEMASDFNKALEFDQGINALSAVTGGMEIAKAKIKELDAVARDTPGLSFLSAVDGQKRLEAVGFEAETATALLKNLSKVRLLSGGTKQDFDAVILNLTQIRAQGKLTGDELRETLGRFPYMARVINDAFGTINTKKIAEMNLSSDDFFNKLNAAMEKVPNVAGGAALAVENFTDSTDRLKIAVGELIEQNPEVIALFRLWTGEVDKVTGAMKDADSQTGKTTRGFISNVAELAVTGQNWANYAVGLYQDTANLVSRLSETVIGEIDFLIKGVPMSFDWMFAKLQEGWNKIANLYNEGNQQMGGYVPNLKTFSVETSSEEYEKRLEEMLGRRQVNKSNRLSGLGGSLNRSWGQNINRADIENRDRMTAYRALVEDEKYSSGQRTIKSLNEVLSGTTKPKWNSANDGELSKDAKKAAEELKRIREDFFIGKKSLSIGDGIELRKNLEGLLSNPKVQLFLETVKQAEGGAPNIMAGGRRVSSLAQHPGETVPMSQWFKGPKGPSSASGDFQITRTNWREIAPLLGIKDFSVKNQALVALEIMRRQGTGGFINLAQGNIEGAFKKGTQPWASSAHSTLPGGKKDYVALARKIGAGGAFDADSSISDSFDPSKISKRLTEEWKEKQNKKVAEIFAQIGLVTDEVIKTTVEEKNKSLEKIGQAQTATEESVRRELLDGARQVSIGVDEVTSIITENIGELPEGTQELLKQFLVVANASKVYGDAVFPLPRTVNQLKSAFEMLNSATRERIVKDQTVRPRVVDDWKQIADDPSKEWALNFQGDRGATRPRIFDQDRISAENELLKSLEYEFKDAQNGGRTPTVYDATKRQIEELLTRFPQLDQARQQEMLSVAAQIDQQERLNRILGQQSNLQDLMVDLQSGAVYDAYAGLDSIVGSLVDHFGMANTAAGNFVQTLLSGLLKLAAQEGFKMLFGGMTGGTGQNQSSGGGWFSKLIGWGVGALLGGIGGGKAVSTGGASTVTHSTQSIGNSIGTGISMRFATGGHVPAQNGGHLAIVGEGGYDEYILSTDPKYRERTAKLLSGFLASSQMMPQYAQGAKISAGRTVAPSYSFPSNYQNESASQGNRKGGGSLTQNFNFYPDPKTGRYSKESAFQEGKKYARMQSDILRRS